MVAPGAIFAYRSLSLLTVGAFIGKLRIPFTTYHFFYIRESVYYIWGVHTRYTKQPNSILVTGVKGFI